MDKLSSLFQKYYAKTATPTEREELMQLLSKASAKVIAELVQEAGLQLSETESVISEPRQEVILKSILGSRATESTPVVHRVHFLRTAWFRYAAAILLLIGVGAYLWQSSKQKNLIVKKDIENKTILNRNQAILTLANGNKILLDNMSKGSIAQQGSTKVIKLDADQLAYQGGTNNKETGYNTITTPRGSQYQIILPDGTKVWLNAASSVSFPVVFTGNERKVEVKGEAYFEVAKNIKQIFKVKVNNQGDIVVIGTSFNVKAYQEDGSFKTSLLEGAVKVNDQLLSPGQAYVDRKVINTNVDQDIAWKKGLFDFNNLPLKQAMNQLARWYDLEIIYEGKLPEYGFYGKVGRDLSLKQVLNVLSDLGEVSFKLIGENKLIVRSSE